MVNSVTRLIEAQPPVAQQSILDNQIFVQLRLCTFFW